MRPFLGLVIIFVSFISGCVTAPLPPAAAEPVRWHGEASLWVPAAGVHVQMEAEKLQRQGLAAPEALAEATWRIKIPIVDQGSGANHFDRHTKLLPQVNGTPL